MKRLFLAICVFLPVATCGAYAAEAEAPPALQQSSQFPEIQAMLKEGKYAQALAAATQATLDHPASAQAHYLVGKAHFYPGQDAQAHAAFSKAIALSPAFADAYFLRGVMTAYGAGHEQGGADLKKACELDATKAKHWFELGKYHERQEQYGDAVPALEKALAIDPKMARAWFALATIASGKKQHASAASMWETALDLDPKYRDAHYNLGLHHQLRGDPHRSLRHFLAAAELRPDDVEANKKVVQAYYRLADYQNAAIYRSKLLDLIASAKDPKLLAMKEFCFDQFDVAHGRVFAYETIAKDGHFFYWHTFHLVDADGNTLKTVNLERNTALDASGYKFMLGQNEGNLHTNFGIGLADVPAYPALKEMVLNALDGKFKAAASTRRGK